MPTALATEETVRYASKQEARSALSKKKLLEAAIRVINTRGYSNLTVRAICAEAGLSTGAFYHLFNSKDDVINYYLIYAYNRYKEDSPDNLDGLSATDKIRRIYRYFIKMSEGVGYEFMRAYYNPNNSIFDFRHRTDRVLLEECRDYLIQGQEDGTIRTDINLDEVVLDIAIIYTGIMFYWCVFKGEMDAESVFERRIGHFLETLEV